MQWERININDNYTGFLISEYGDLKHEKTGIVKNKTKVRGYVRYSFPTKDGRKGVYAHRLVAQYFLDATEEERKLEINHKDGIKDSNHFSNLEYVTHTENVHHAIKTGLLNDKNMHKRKIKVYNTKGEFLFECESASEAERQTGESSGNICAICRNGRLKTSNGYQYRYSEDGGEVKDVSHLFNGKFVPIAQKTVDGETIKIYPSIVSANVEMGHDRGYKGIRSCLRKERLTVDGYVWEYYKNN